MKPDPCDILLLEPYYSGSHRQWADGLKRHSRHRIELMTLPGRLWKWRMYGAAVTFANRVIAAMKPRDAIFCSDMMDVATFAGLVRRHLPGVPIGLYFHENQITYPASPRESRMPENGGLQYGFINYTSALAADRVYFNSRYHMESFLEALSPFLSRFPDFRNKPTIAEIRKKSRVLHLGLDLKGLDRRRDPGGSEDRPPLLLWNHRWEHDKRPEVFFRLLFTLQDRGVRFEVALLGDRRGEAPPCLEEARRRLGPAIVCDGHVDRREAYVRWLHRADILPVTSIHDFFGASVIEAVACGCHPVLPRRLAYPEHFGDANVFYDSEDDAVDRLEALICSGEWQRPSPLAGDLMRYDWGRMAGIYDAELADLVTA